MSTPFQLIWSDVSNNVLTTDWFPVAFPGTTSVPLQLQVKSNASALQTYEVLEGVKFFLTGDADDVDIVQNVWPGLGGPNKPELSGGYEVSFDFGRTYIRFDSLHGLESSPSTWITLPSEAVGAGGLDGTLGPFDTAHLIVRVVVPPGADQFRAMHLRLGMDFDII